MIRIVVFYVCFPVTIGGGQYRFYSPGDADNNSIVSVANIVADENIKVNIEKLIHRGKEKDVEDHYTDHWYVGADQLHPLVKKKLTLKDLVKK